jgi:hypothetical protein
MRAPKFPIEYVELVVSPLAMSGKKSDTEQQATTIGTRLPR